ncbi:MAG: glyoxylate/hydroxypyruvate reductase A [Acidisphaera sp.]|nr:glyoxylate/hydroxypyruvate reductase A [Acidisphaera sp.]
MSGASPVLLVRSGGPAALPEWRAAFAAVLPGIEVLGWTDPDLDPARVRWVLVWEPEPGRIAGYPNLRAVFSTAAGVDHITRDPFLPPHLPIVRMGAEEMARSVGEYVTMAALMILRDAPRMLAAHEAGRWDAFFPPRTARETRVGILGLGRIGQMAAGMLRGIGFPVQGWTRTRRTIQGVESFAGIDELDAFLASSDILVGILPDTPQTRALLNRERLAKLPKGAGLVSAGRGTLVVLPDLLAALDAGHLSFAVLDVFETEPLPPDSPAWKHPRVLVTAHVAGFASRRARAESVARAVAQIEAGEQPDNLYDRERGY